MSIKDEEHKQEMDAAGGQPADFEDDVSPPAVAPSTAAEAAVNEEPGDEIDGHVGAVEELPPDPPNDPDNPDNEESPSAVEVADDEELGDEIDSDVADVEELPPHSLGDDTNDESADPDVPYRADAKGMYRRLPSGDWQQLSNFSARILREVITTDGLVETREYVVTAEIGRVSRELHIPANKFNSMGWMMDVTASATVTPGPTNREHLAGAIRMLSGEIPEVREFAHTGWRHVAGEWVYLTSGGAITRSGLSPEITVQLNAHPTDRITSYCLPAPPIGDGAKEAVSKAISLLNVGCDRIMFPLVAAVFRAVFGDADFSIFLYGPSGSFKTALAAVAVSHCGNFSDRSLPGSWESTANSLEAVAFRLKDVLFVVDDFCPRGSRYDVNGLHGKADRLLRGAGNQAGRGRMNADSSQRPTYYPRSLILSTGEDIPRGHSLRGRILSIQVENGDIAGDALSRAQRLAADGVLARAMAAYIHHLAQDYDRHRDEFASRVSTETAHWRELDLRSHNRLPGILADLQVGLEYFLEFALAIEAISPDEFDDLRERLRAGLNSSATDHAKVLKEENPGEVFVGALRLALAAKRVHLVNCEGHRPENHDRWGWPVDGDLPRGCTKIGWVAGNDIYLDPTIAFNEIKRWDPDRILVSAQSMWSSMKSSGLLKSCDLPRQTNTIRRKLEGEQRAVLHIDVSAVFLTDPDEPESGGPAPIAGEEIPF